MSLLGYYLRIENMADYLVKYCAEFQRVAGEPVAVVALSTVSQTAEERGFKDTDIKDIIYAVEQRAIIDYDK